MRLDFNYLYNSLQQTFPHRVFGLNIFETLDSTNRYLLEKETQHLHICLAEQQTAGRGSRGKQWVSPFGVNLYCSISWPFRKNNLAGLSLAIGVMVAKMLKEYGVPFIGLKWPNDVLCQNKKIAGILIETNQAQNGRKVVMGIGVNVFLSRVLHPKDPIISQPWTDVESAISFQPNRNDLALQLLIQVVHSLPLFEQQGFAAFLSEWLAEDVFFNQTIKLKTAQGIVNAISRGVDERGHLLVEISGKIKSFVNAEIIQ